MYLKFVTVEKGKNVLYVKLNKALYRCMKIALLWYQTFKGRLDKMGFTVNPYDPCVANKIIDGHQCTICWYVDDNKISLKDPKVVDKIISELEQEFGTMTVKRGQVHDFVGMRIELLNDGKVFITMDKYIKESIEAFGEEIKG